MTVLQFTPLQCKQYAPSVTATSGKNNNHHQSALTMPTVPSSKLKLHLSYRGQNLFRCCYIKACKLNSSNSSEARRCLSRFLTCVISL
jgi:hypothetical protein